MKKETTIDLAKFEEAKKAIEEAQKTIDSIGSQFCEMVLDEVEKNPVFECEFIRVSDHEERYFSTLTICNITVHLRFYVYVASDLSKSLFGVKLDCSSLDLDNVSIKLRKCLQLRLNVLEKCTSTLLQCKAPGN